MCLPSYRFSQRSCALLILHVCALTMLFGCGPAQKPQTSTPSPQVSSQPNPMPGTQPVSPAPPVVPQTTSPPQVAPVPAATADSDDVKRLLAVGGVIPPQLGPKQFLTNESIKDIQFTNQPQSDADFAIIEKFPNARMIVMQSGKITDAGLSSVAKLKHLKELWITSTPISDAGLVHLQELVDLERLVLNSTPISDDGLKNFRGMKKLKSLHLVNCGGITDKGIDELENLKSLEQLYVESTRVTAAGADRLRAALPNCKIIK
ncbi:MAG: hypothetical protein K8R36_00220 [Planctomycetales bacterium]|nr:hypothetical protein [Planctomycetales bacterium]